MCKCCQGPRMEQNHFTSSIRYEDLGESYREEMSPACHWLPISIGWLIYFPGSHQPQVTISPISGPKSNLKYSPTLRHSTCFPVAKEILISHNSLLLNSNLCSIVTFLESNYKIASSSPSGTIFPSLLYFSSQHIINSDMCACFVFCFL